MSEQDNNNNEGHGIIGKILSGENSTFRHQVLSSEDPLGELDKAYEKNANDPLAERVEKELVLTPEGREILYKGMVSKPERTAHALERISRGPIWTYSPARLVKTIAEEWKDKYEPQGIYQTTILEPIMRFMLARNSSWGDTRIYDPNPEELITLKNYFAKHGHLFLEYWDTEGNADYFYNLWVNSTNEDGFDIIDLLEKNQRHVSKRLREVQKGKVLEQPRKERKEANAELTEKREKIMADRRAHIDKISDNIYVRNAVLHQEMDYEQFRENVLRRIKDPNFWEFTVTNTSKRRKHEYFSSIKRISKKHSVDNGFSEKLFQDMLFNPFVSPVLQDLINIEKEDEDRRTGLKTDELEFSSRTIIKDILARPEMRKSGYWARNNLYEDIQDIFVATPQVFNLIVEECFDIYLHQSSRKQREEMRNILQFLITVPNDEQKARGMEYSNYILDPSFDTEFKQKVFNTVEKTFTSIFGEATMRTQAKDNIEYLTAYEGWTALWKSQIGKRILTEIFNDDEPFFDMMIKQFMTSNISGQDKKFFDNIRMLSKLSKKIEQESVSHKNSINKLGTIEDEIEKHIVKRVGELIKRPTIEITVGEEFKDPKIFLKAVLNQYIASYDAAVSIIEDREFRISNELNVIAVNAKNKALIQAICDSGIDIAQIYHGDRNEYTYIRVNPELTAEDITQHFLRILVSPTVYEWGEDENNRSLFFLPEKVVIHYDNSEGRKDKLITMDKRQRTSFKKRYLDWYMETRMLMGDSSEMSRILYTWLSYDRDLRDYQDMCQKGLIEKYRRISPELESMLSVAYKYEKDQVSPILQDMLGATNIEQLVPLIRKDNVFLGLLSSIMSMASLEKSREIQSHKNVQRLITTQRSIFGGVKLDPDVSSEKKKEIFRALKKLGFTETEDGLERFQHLFRSLTSLRGSRGSHQTVSITPAGLKISNPFRNMYELEKVTQTDNKGTRIERFEREYDGGEDDMLITWGMIKSIDQTQTDYSPWVDIRIKIKSFFAKNKPEKVKDWEDHGTANIIARLPGRNEPLFELPAMPEAKQVWKLIKKFAELMDEEQGFTDNIELLKFISNQNG